MKHEFIADHYLVAFIDVLGQSSAVLEGDAYPPATNDMQRKKARLKENSEYIVTLRDLFKKHYKKYRKNKDVFEGLNDRQKKNEQIMRAFKAEIKGVSDSMIINVPLENKTDNCIPVNNILATIQGICLIYNYSMSQQKPIRGGVDIGLGIRLGESEVYGSALVKAYQLETEKAGYPRVLIGESLWQYLNYVENQNAKTQYGIRAKKLAKQCKSYIKKSNNHFFIDVIGEAVKNSGLEINKSQVSQCYDHIVSVQKKYEKKNDTKLSSRYLQLKQYYQTNLPIW